MTQSSRPASAPGTAAGKRKGAYHHGNLRQAIIDAAVALVTESGLEAMTLREAARRAGVSSGAPFRHFPDKRELVQAVAEQGMAILRSTMEDSLARSPAQGPLVQLAVLAHAYVDWAMRHPTYYRVLGDRLLIDFYASEPLLRDNRWIRQKMQDLLAAAADAGMLAITDLARANLQARAMAYGLARMWVDGHFPEFDLAAKAAAGAAMTDALDGFVASLAKDPAAVLGEIRALRG
ncbi:TetR/AcrR family transcriptional regulator [Erythrobacter sp. CCH5-A1]|jgi:AcrR family transcriptional regulator|uniref:TetR/AcrR family transcriptional regulator n=1 Tax=Erythrobacter sp. CCH5-A1 TaxID=1768792 RepID=UPI000831D4D3|nr:TetR/AcrR family transcriptional regulator [Erythrobacter sp. CCH5-A1]